ncbi:MAG TPA: hypothetical protein DHW82_10810 [Spirochaetia bacterium]|nr:MAG: hypothetical protein A2Y41_09640 [Spirochaetes bacterium GWB1_36_13]HCL57483.1 hypothetical protein [Spirochaetia bacterium]
MKISSNCYAVTGLYYLPPWTLNAGFIVGKNKTLVIDSGSNKLSAQTIYGYARAVRPENEILLVNTEKHLDHIGGNRYFYEKKAEILGHKAIQRTQNEFLKSVRFINDSLFHPVRKNLNEGFYAFEKTEIMNPIHLIDKNIEIDLGNFSAQIILTPGHTDSNLCVYHQDDKVLYSGDMILSQFVPNLEEGGQKEWKAWLTSLEKIKSLDIEIVVTGHGEVILGKADIEKEIGRIEKILFKAIQDDKAPTVM